MKVRSAAWKRGRADAGPASTGAGVHLTHPGCSPECNPGTAAGDQRSRTSCHDAQGEEACDETRFGGSAPPLWWAPWSQPQRPSSWTGRWPAAEVSPPPAPDAPTARPGHHPRPDAVRIRARAWPHRPTAAQPPTAHGQPRSQQDDSARPTATALATVNWLLRPGLPHHPVRKAKRSATSRQEQPGHPSSSARRTLRSVSSFSLSTSSPSLHRTDIARGSVRWSV